MKIVKSLIVIVAILAVAAVATGAYFTDQQTISGNTFTAGGVHIQINGAGASPQTIANMAPGVCGAPIEYDVYNLANSLPVKYMFNASMTSESVAGYYNNINVIVRHTHAGTPNPAAWPIVYQGSLSGMTIDSTATAGIISPTLGTNITHVFYLQYCLDSSTGNAYQGATATASLIFNATQTNNPGWTP